ncbi:MAG: cobalt-precorrin-5B (C(1))-methyltransferase CbiD [Lachnospiraceae bacterium]|nr:cobalt-precorrin-5B (C(1))-methyltransferase CbiD [Lachnospiraceae bacterium]
MDYGFTTGSCAAAAAKAAAYMLLGGVRLTHVTIITPAGIEYKPEIEDMSVSSDMVSCAVRKYAGDDPDVTNGTLVYVSVSLVNDGKNAISIDGGQGVGRVTRPGLDQPVGNAAINSVPRQMIGDEVRKVMNEYDYPGSLSVIISVPDGEEIARKTFNPRLGIEGGISIIGTTGIVEPMSTRALIDTIRVELNQIRAEGAQTAVISPGNYGMDFMREHYGYDLDRAVKCSNYIGETLDVAGELGFKSVLLCGHIGKLVKLSGGIMNTHSHEADCRMELMAAAAVRSGAGTGLLNSILDCVSTEEAYQIMEDAGIAGRCMEHIMDRIAFYMDARVKGRIATECIVYASKWGLLGKTAGAEELLVRSTGAAGLPDRV